MSHSVNIKTQIKQVHTLLGVFDALGWNIKENEKCRTYYSDPSKDTVHRYVAVNPKEQGYDIGIDVNEQGEAYFTCDFFDRSIESQLGKNLQKVKQNYSLAQIKQFMLEEGLDYTVSELENGQLKVVGTH
jgi:predicted transcriptional regulator